MKIRTALNYDYSNVENEKNMLPSLTIPDETLALKEILYRFTNGIVPMNMRELPYDKDGVTIDDDVNPVNDSELTLSDLHQQMSYHYDRYRNLVDEEKRRHDEEAKRVSEAVASDG